METTEFISYETRSNLLAAMQSCKITLSDKPDLENIIFHRDSDIYNNDEIDKDRVFERLENLNKLNKIRHHLFQTEYYDIESYFINEEHINSLYPNFTTEKLTELIEEATEEAKEKSLDKLYNKIEVFRKEAELKGETYKFSYSKTIAKLKSEYEENPKRYRYGKTVLGLLVGKLENGYGNIDLLQKTNKINIEQLQKIIENYKVNI